MRLLKLTIPILLFTNLAFSEPEYSPKTPWNSYEIVEEKESSMFMKTLLWIPNRFLDLVDTVKIDVGIGFSFGAVARVTSQGQFGYRDMDPTSFRVGNFGRTYPFLVETSNEFGAGPAFVSSSDREVCPGEIGLGIDLFIPAAYAGICVSELVDFIGGFFFWDPLNDDLR